MNNIPYELHLTVEINNKDIPKFRESCKTLKIKPIIIELSEEISLRDIMTSSVFKGNDKTVYEEMERIKSSLSGAGFKVIREKIETIPWHSKAPQSIRQKMPNNCYFESHIPITLPKCDKIWNKINKVAKFHNSHLSFNAFKKNTTSLTKMVTLRSADCFFIFKGKLTALLKDLELETQYPLNKVITEFALYDSNVSHDNKWLNIS